MGMSGVSCITVSYFSGKPRLEITNSRQMQATFSAVRMDERMKMWHRMRTEDKLRLSSRNINVYTLNN